MSTYKKGDGEDLFFGFDWSAWLDGEQIATSDWDVPEGITANTQEIIGRKTRVRVSGGTVGERYVLTNTITTTPSGETAERSLRVLVVSERFD